MECSTCMIVGSKCKTIDLSYPLNETTIFWPGGEKFKLCMRCTSDDTTGNFYSAGVFSCAEHGGTHVDAPFHFSETGATVDLIPLDDLIASCRVVDITDNCNLEGNGDYMLSADDILKHEEQWGKIEERTIVLIRTGWSKHWQNGPQAYLGFDESDGPYDSSTSQLSFPGIGAEAAELLVQRNVAAVGLDTGNSIKYW